MVIEQRKEMMSLNSPPPATKAQQQAVARLLEHEDVDLLKEATAVLGDDADAWLDSENARLGGKKPRELIGSPGTDAAAEEVVRELLRGIKYAVFS
jgi:hypothetical protein